MNTRDYFRSITDELEALKDRVRNLIDDKHWGTDGEWKEAVLRAMLAERLPDTVKVGRGFILTASGPTTQIDILLYRASSPVLFRQGDLVFVTPDAVLGVVEVKSWLDATLFRDAVRALAKIGRQLEDHRQQCCLALFSYEAANVRPGWFSRVLPEACMSRSSVIELINVGCSCFVKWWDRHPEKDGQSYGHWHSYELQDISAGYFISNLIGAVSGGFSEQSSKFWFPVEEKEPFVTSQIPSNFDQCD